MKFKYLVLLIASLNLSYTSEAQLLKKLKKKAEQAVERTILKKTDEVVTKKTEQAIDSVTASKSKKKKSTKVAPKNNSEAKKTVSNKNEADLELQNSVQPLSTQLGGAVTFTIAIDNKGPAVSNNIISKVIIPNSYTITRINVTQGSYDVDSNLWDIGTLDASKRAVMTVMVVVMNDKNLMTTGEIINYSTQDPDSKPNNGIDTNRNSNIIDDKGDEDDGDGQDVKIGDVIVSNSETDDEDVKMVMEHKRDKIISYLDFNTMAMRMEYHSKGKNPDPVYWDKDGYIYSGEKGQYYKIPFNQIKSMGKNMMKMFTAGSKGMPGAVLPKVNGKDVDLDFPSEPITYNGFKVHIYPNKYPILEWAFVYKPEIFKGADDVTEEIVACRGSSGCTKFTLTAGKLKGSTVLFDNKNRLAKITNPNGASAVYTYEPTTVKLPKAKSTILILKIIKSLKIY
ncbi:MAG: DUF11 domain-containing protein [Flavobacteriaceae bacterium]